MRENAYPKRPAMYSCVRVSWGWENLIITLLQPFALKKRLQNRNSSTCWVLSGARMFVKTLSSVLSQALDSGCRNRIQGGVVRQQDHFGSQCQGAPPGTNAVLPAG